MSTQLRKENDPACRLDFRTQYVDAQYKCERSYYAAAKKLPVVFGANSFVETLLYKKSFTEMVDTPRSIFIFEAGLCLQALKGLRMVDVRLSLIRLIL
ncbi:hypothetical protein BDW75DRAFT_195806 [Aspergillus navahoensis]